MMRVVLSTAMRHRTVRDGTRNTSCSPRGRSSSNHGFSLDRAGVSLVRRERLLPPFRGDSFPRTVGLCSCRLCDPRAFLDGTTANPRSVLGTPLSGARGSGLNSGVRVSSRRLSSFPPPPLLPAAEAALTQSLGVAAPPGAESAASSSRGPGGLVFGLPPASWALGSCAARPGQN